ncbi:required for meiotic nuclear division protein 1 homolog isoform X3 [Symsagittifera roscoffensis]|uniref:required for meiotic nuclear division protein 1 homolog isoform X3 n=1 Tax=Symsagittifera roscoffensis TaxID=84072 RepID=UPI00307C7D81
MNVGRVPLAARHGFLGYLLPIYEDLKKYPHICSGWTTCDELLVHQLVDEILKEFPNSRNDCVPLDVEDEIFCVDNLVASGTQKISISDDLLRPRLFLFDFGCLVFWNVDHSVARIVRRIADERGLQKGSYDPSIVLQENDSIPFVKDSSRSIPHIRKELIRFPNELSLRDIILYQFAYSNSMALSVKLAYWEIAVEGLVRSMSPYINQMRSGHVMVQDEEIMKMYGELFHFDHRINLSSDFLDIPEIYWNQSLLEEAFLSMRLYLGVKERVRIIGVKITQSFNLLEMLRSHLNETSSHRLEQWIIMLISLEILICLVTPELILQILQDVRKKLFDSSTAYVETTKYRKDSSLNIID